MSPEVNHSLLQTIFVLNTTCVSYAFIIWLKKWFCFIDFRLEISLAVLVHYVNLIVGRTPHTPPVWKPEYWNSSNWTRYSPMTWIVLTDSGPQWNYTHLWNSSINLKRKQNFTANEHAFLCITFLKKKLILTLLKFTYREELSFFSMKASSI